MTDDSNIHKYYTIYTYIDIVYNISILMLMQLLAIISMFYRSM